MTIREQAMQEAIELYLMDHRDRCRPCTARFETALSISPEPCPICIKREKAAAELAKALGENHDPV